MVLPHILDAANLAPACVRARVCESVCRCVSVCVCMCVYVLACVHVCVRAVCTCMRVLQPLAMPVRVSTARGGAAKVQSKAESS